MNSKRDGLINEFVFEDFGANICLIENHSSEIRLSLYKRAIIKSFSFVPSCRL